MTRELIHYLSSFVTEERYELFRHIAAKRTRYISLLLENIYQSQNASAVLRTCDCFGIQDVHVVENDNPWKINPDVSMGSDKWLDLQYYNAEGNNTARAVKSLKEAGYRLVATSPHTRDIPLQELDLEKGKLVLMFGTELRGLSEEALELADEYVYIPMRGFTESFNISVSAALVLYELRNRLEASDIPWKLSEKEYDELLLHWLKKSVKMSGKLIDQYLKKH